MSGTSCPPRTLRHDCSARRGGVRRLSRTIIASHALVPGFLFIFKVVYVCGFKRHILRFALMQNRFLFKFEPTRWWIRESSLVLFFPLTVGDPKKNATISQFFLMIIDHWKKQGIVWPVWYFHLFFINMGKAIRLQEPNFTSNRRLADKRAKLLFARTPTVQTTQCFSGLIFKCSYALL